MKPLSNLGTAPVMVLGLLGFVFATAAFGQTQGSSLWRLEIDSQWLGPVVTQVQVDRTGDALRARSRSGVLEKVRELPGAEGNRAHLEHGLFAFEARRTADDEWSGQVIAPWAVGPLVLRFDGAGGVSGRIDGGGLGGAVSGRRIEEAPPVRDYVAVLDTARAVVADKIFEPADLEAPGYAAFMAWLATVAGEANDDLDWLLAFNWGWRNDPFSHFSMRRSAASAEDMLKFFDGMRVGGEPARVRFEGEVAVLRVDTMMGQDTIELIDAAYARIAERGAKALVIDLLGNGGGAFAVKPLVEHVIERPLDAGFFIAHQWNVEHDGVPDAAALEAYVPWAGWSISAFHRAVQDEGVVRVRFHPAEPGFRGPVFVAVDGRSASATELAADALRASGRVTLVGERTAGEMLSQSFFDVRDGFMVALPIADYYSVAHGRIEGVGVPVDVPAPSDTALEHALRLARESIEVAGSP